MGGLCLGDLIVRFGFGSMDKIGEFNGVLNKENWNIVSDDIPVSWDLKSVSEIHKLGIVVI